MAYKSAIQWCDDTTNPVAGCDGCPLWPDREVFVHNSSDWIAKYVPGIPFFELRAALRGIWDKTLLPSRRAHVRAFTFAAFSTLAPQVEEWRIQRFSEELQLDLRCYAGAITHRYAGSKGYPESFDIPSLFPGRVGKSAKSRPPTPEERKDKPWLAGCKRLIFVSDMGDALSTSVSFEYLREEIVNNAASPDGKRHVFLWLTKRPARMAEFCRWLEANGTSWPQNLIPMSSILNAAYARLALHLLAIPAAVHGFSVEPLDEPLVLPKELLAAKPWIILGGESGHASRLHSFDTQWAYSIRDQCAAAGAPFFLKQLGGAPTWNGLDIRLNDKHGGDWAEWPLDLRIRQVPEAFRMAA